MELRSVDTNIFAVPFDFPMINRDDEMENITRKKPYGQNRTENILNEGSGKET
jgi:hypothetical protein